MHGNCIRFKSTAAESLLKVDSAYDGWVFLQWHAWCSVSLWWWWCCQCKV